MLLGVYGCDRCLFFACVVDEPVNLALIYVPVLSSFMKNMMFVSQFGARHNGRSHEHGVDDFLKRQISYCNIQVLRSVRRVTHKSEVYMSAMKR